MTGGKISSLPPKISLPAPCVSAGSISRHYKWREGVGPAGKRPLTRNYFWGGKDTNRVGTHEFVDLCRRVGAEPFYCVNFASDGEKRFLSTKEGNRTGDAREAADWVSYANDPGQPGTQAERPPGTLQSQALATWQRNLVWTAGPHVHARSSHRRYLDFAKAMQRRDPSLELIGWGDHGEGNVLWASRIAKARGRPGRSGGDAYDGAIAQASGYDTERLTLPAGPRARWQDLARYRPARNPPDRNGSTPLPRNPRQRGLPSPKAISA